MWYLKGKYCRTNTPSQLQTHTATRNWWTQKMCPFNLPAPLEGRRFPHPRGGGGWTPAQTKQFSVHTVHNSRQITCCLPVLSQTFQGDSYDSVKMMASPRSSGVNY